MEDAKYYTWKDLEEMDANRLRMEVMRLQQYIIRIRGDASTILDWVNESIGINAKIDQQPSDEMIRKIVLQEKELKRMETTTDIEFEYEIDSDRLHEVVKKLVKEGLLDEKQNEAE